MSESFGHKKPRYNHIYQIDNKNEENICGTQAHEQSNIPLSTHASGVSVRIAVGKNEKHT